jgi:hypothetical protein
LSLARINSTVFSVTKWMFSCEFFLQAPDSVKTVPRGVADNNGEDVADHDGGMKAPCWLIVEGV